MKEYERMSLQKLSPSQTGISNCTYIGLPNIIWTLQLPKHHKNGFFLNENFNFYIAIKKQIWFIFNLGEHDHIKNTIIKNITQNVWFDFIYTKRLPA